MAKRVSDKILDSVLQVMKRFPQGASLEDLLKAMFPPMPKRSLQRYLAFLVSEGRLNTLGQARSRRYHLLNTESEKSISVISSQNIPSAKDAHPVKLIENLIPLSSSLYSATHQELGEPDPFRLKYRNLIITTLGEIVRGCMDKQAAVAAIRKKGSENIAKNDQARFMEIIETELMSLHKGNIARFRLKLPEYEMWLKMWH